MQKQITAIIEREGDGYVSPCPELDIASQGDTVTEARDNLREAIELFFETASTEEIQTRLHEEVYITRIGSGSWVGSVSSQGNETAVSRYFQSKEKQSAYASLSGTNLARGATEARSVKCRGFFGFASHSTGERMLMEDL